MFSNPLTDKNIFWTDKQGKLQSTKLTAIRPIGPDYLKFSYNIPERQSNRMTELFMTKGFKIYEDEYSPKSRSFITVDPDLYYYRSGFVRNTLSDFYSVKSLFGDKISKHIPIIIYDSRAERSKGSFNSAELEKYIYDENRKSDFTSSGNRKDLFLEIGYDNDYEYIFRAGIGVKTTIAHELLHEVQHRDLLRDLVDYRPGMSSKQHEGIMKEVGYNPINDASNMVKNTLKNSVISDIISMAKNDSIGDFVKKNPGKYALKDYLYEDIDRKQFVTSIFEAAKPLTGKQRSAIFFSIMLGSGNKIPKKLQERVDDLLYRTSPIETETFSTAALIVASNWDAITKNNKKLKGSLFKHFITSNPFYGLEPGFTDVFAPIPSLTKIHRNTIELFREKRRSIIGSYHILTDPNYKPNRYPFAYGFVGGLETDKVWDAFSKNMPDFKWLPSSYEFYGRRGIPISQIGDEELRKSVHLGLLSELYDRNNIDPKTKLPLYESLGKTFSRIYNEEKAKISQELQRTEGEVYGEELFTRLRPFIQKRAYKNPEVRGILSLLGKRYLDKIDKNLITGNQKGRLAKFVKEALGIPFKSPFKNTSILNHGYPTGIKVPVGYGSRVSILTKAYKRKLKQNTIKGISTGKMRKVITKVLDISFKSPADNRRKIKFGQTKKVEIAPQFVLDQKTKVLIDEKTNKVSSKLYSFARTHLKRAADKTRAIYPDTKQYNLNYKLVDNEIPSLKGMRAGTYIEASDKGRPSGIIILQSKNILEEYNPFITLTDMLYHENQHFNELAYLKSKVETSTNYNFSKDYANVNKTTDQLKERPRYKGSLSFFHPNPNPNASPKISEYIAYRYSPAELSAYPAGVLGRVLNWEDHFGNAPFARINAAAEHARLFGFSYDHGSVLFRPTHLLTKNLSKEAQKALEILHTRQGEHISEAVPRLIRPSYDTPKEPNWRPSLYEQITTPIRNILSSGESIEEDELVNSIRLDFMKYMHDNKENLFEDTSSEYKKVLKTDKNIKVLEEEGMKAFIQRKREEENLLIEREKNLKNIIEKYAKSEGLAELISTVDRDTASKVVKRALGVHFRSPFNKTYINKPQKALQRATRKIKAAKSRARKLQNISVTKRRQRKR